MRVATYIANFLKEKEIYTVFELQGGMITRMIDEIHRLGGIDIVSMHHEQAASFAADAYARVRNRPGVAFATSGPGATNLITGIGNCYFDSVPAIFITGQVNIHEQKGDKAVRQIGFQETDIISVVASITKAAFAVKSAEKIPEIFEQAWKISQEGRQGPVLIDIPMNIQNEEIEVKQTDEKDSLKQSLDNKQVNDFLQKLNKELERSKRPLILVGRGIRASDSVREFIDFSNTLEIPVVSSLLALDVLPYDNPLRVGFIGTYGNRWANFALGKCDFLLVLGSRLDLRQTGADVDTFQRDKKVFHIDIDKAELNNRLTDCEILHSDLKDFFNQCNNRTFSKPNIKEWLGQIEQKSMDWPDDKELKDISGINPNSFMHSLSSSSDLAFAYTADVGNNQMWAAQSLKVFKEQLFITSGGMGAMGYSLPAAIGICIANGKSPVVSISGDGGFQINIQELQTIVRNNLPVKIVILNNKSLGMIRQFQDKYFESCYQSTVWGYSTPDFEAVSKAYGIDSCTISELSEIEQGLNHLWEDPSSPYVLNVNIDVYTNVCPKMLYGSPLDKMDPALD